MRSAGNHARTFACLAPMVVFGSGFLIPVRNATAADGAAVTTAIRRGAEFLRGQLNADSGLRSAERSVVALALLKAGEPPDSPLLTGAVDAVVAKTVGGYVASEEYHIYEAGVDATLLADYDGERFVAELQAIGDFISENQLSTGAWDYHESNGRPSRGDTSVTQYACLGLWAVARSGAVVADSVWENVLQWHRITQRSGGQFEYTPDIPRVAHPRMTAAGCSSMIIAMISMAPDHADSIAAQIRTGMNGGTHTGRKFDVLERVGVRGERIKPEPPIIRQMLPAARRSWSAASIRFIPENPTHRFYYYYTLERITAFADSEMLGDHDWFDRCADEALPLQREDGSWASLPKNLYGSAVHSSFAVLFLSRSTAKTLGRNFGGGLMLGGRGLPSDLAGSRIIDGKVVSSEIDSASLDELLASLEEFNEANAASVQKAIVDQIQLGDREDLVTQKDRLAELIHHDNPEIRRTAIWALSRTANLTEARMFIDALEDRDLDVIIEARNALCFVSRNPNGFGMPVSPITDLPHDVSEEERLAAIQDWQRKVHRRWLKWYVRVRPWDDRDDILDSRAR